MRIWPPPLRYTLPLALLLFVATGGILGYRYTRKQELRNIENNARERASILGTRISTMASYLMENGPILGIQREVALTAADRDVEVALIFDGKDRVIFSSRFDLQGLPIEETPALPYATIVSRARQRGAGIVRLPAARNKVLGAFPFPITKRTGGALRESETGVFFLELDLTHRKEVAEAAGMRRLFRQAGIVGGPWVVISLAFALMLNRRVRRLNDSAAQLAAGDLTARSALSGGDELATLSRTIDEMAGRLQRSTDDLRETEARFAFLVEGIPQVFWLMEIEPERFIYVGPSFEKIWGRSVDDLYRDPNMWIKCVHPEDRSRASAAFLSWITGRASGYDETYRIIADDGSERWIRDRGIRLEPAVSGRKRVAGLAEDITSEHLREAEQADLEHKLRETQKLESLGVLAGGIAHDFNNLLAGILGNASLAREEAAPNSSVQPYLEHIESAAVRAAELCKQMLAYSGKGRFQVQRLSLSTLVQETTQLIQLSINKAATLQLDLPEELPAIEADPTQMRQVVMNLVINAGEAIQSGNGAVTVRTGVFHADREYLQDTVLSPTLEEGDYVFLEVSDTGEGMPPETKARIFEPFFTTKFAGRGLGLSAVLGIVRGHRGAIRVDSEPGKGTTFRLIFPVVEGEEEPLPEQHLAEYWKGSGKVLIVDDDPTVRAVTARMVEKFGFTTILANDGRDGVDRFRQDQSEITVVLMDLTMPQFDGEAAFREMRAINPNVPVILMSGFNEQDAVRRFNGSGLAGFLSKPFRPDTLRKKLRDLLEPREKVFP